MEGELCEAGINVASDGSAGAMSVVIGSIQVSTKEVSFEGEEEVRGVGEPSSARRSVGSPEKGGRRGVDAGRRKASSECVDGGRLGSCVLGSAVNGRDARGGLAQPNKRLGQVGKPARSRLGQTQPEIVVLGVADSFGLL